MGSEFREQLQGTYHDYEQQYETDTPVLYQAINPLSVSSVILACFSWLAFFHWGFLILSIAGVLVGLAGMINLTKAKDSKIGLWLSGSGIALSLLIGFGCYGLAVYLYYYSTPIGYELVNYETLESDDPNQPFPQAAFELDGERIFIRGYMYPSRQQTGLKHFIMSRDNGVCQYCIPSPKVTDQVFIELEGEREAAYTTRLIGIGGVFSMKIEDPKGKYGGIIYHIEADYLR